MSSVEAASAAGYDRAAVAALDSRQIPVTTKGFGGVGDDEVTAGQLVSRSPGLFNGTFTFPLLAVRAQALATNLAQMSRFAADHQVRLAPHAKTTMAPHLFAAQLEAGAWGLTVATITQAQVCRRFGVQRILLANELVDRAGIAWLAAELATYPDFDLVCYVDSVDGVRLLDGELSRAAGPGVGRPLGVLLELGYDGGRTGCRTPGSARAVIDAVRQTTTLTIAGVAGYEGGLAHDRSPQSREAVLTFCGRLLDLGSTLAVDSDTRLLLTAGGSAFPDLVTAALADASGWSTVVLRSGCYLTHDDGEYARISPFTQSAGSPYALTAALELWAPVLSRPEPGLALLGAGRRDVGFDQGLPVPLMRRDQEGAVSALLGARVTRLNDQHAFLELPADAQLAVGDLVSLGVSHPCTTIDRWPYLVQVDPAYQVTGLFPTFF